MAKGKNIGAWIGGSCTVLAALIAGLFMCNQPSKATTEVTQNGDSNTVNAAQRDVKTAARDQYNAERDMTVTNNYGDTTKKPPIIVKQAPTVIIDQSVKTVGQTGGIAAHTVIVPTDTTNIPLIDNFIVTVEQKNEQIVLSAHPKQGVWYKPFFAYPVNEVPVVQGELHSTGVSVIRESDKGILTFNGVEIPVKMLCLDDKSVTPRNSYIFLCKELPSALYYGDLPGKIYVYRK